METHYRDEENKEYLFDGSVWRNGSGEIEEAFFISKESASLQIALVREGVWNLEDFKGNNGLWKEGFLYYLDKDTRKLKNTGLLKKVEERPQRKRVEEKSPNEIPLEKSE